MLKDAKKKLKKQGFRYMLTETYDNMELWEDYHPGRYQHIYYNTNKGIIVIMVTASNSSKAKINAIEAGFSEMPEPRPGSNP